VTGLRQRPRLLEMGVRLWDPTDYPACPSPVGNRSNSTSSREQRRHSPRFRAISLAAMGKYLGRHHWRSSSPMPAGDVLGSTGRRKRSREVVKARHSCNYALQHCLGSRGNVAVAGFRERRPWLSSAIAGRAKLRRRLRPLDGSSNIDVNVLSAPSSRSLRRG